MKGAQAVVECLVEEGVEIVFGYPGGMILPLYDALYDDTRIQQILTTHEQSAAHAADGYARASGKVGVCIATSGPGATNLVTGIATAFMDSIPLVAITGQVDTTLLGRDAFQETDIIGVTMSVTKHNFKVKDPKKLISTLRLAFQTAKSGRPGPVLVDVPRDLFFAETVFEAPSASKVFAKPAADFLICVAEAAEVIQKANRPVIIAGGGVISAGASRELCLFAEKFNLPVANTLMGISAFPHDHHLSLGFAGMHGLETANNAIAEADLIIAVGSRFGDRQTGNRDKYTHNTHFIHIDIDPAELDKNVASSIGLAGNMKVILTLLMQYEPLRSLDRWWNVLQGWQAKYKRDYDGTYLNVPWAMDCINQLSKDKNIAIATDVGQHQMWAAQHLRLQEPRTWISSGGLGTMGFGLPAALGAQLAFGKTRRLIHIAGDGGIKMTGNEYYTIARLNLPIISILINNSSLGMIRQLQKVQYNERYIACDMTYPMDYVLYAKSFGIEGAAVSTTKALKQALQYAFSVDRPQVIVLNIEHEFVQPMIKYGAEINEFVEF